MQSINLGEDFGYAEIIFSGLQRPLRLDVYAECEALHGMLAGEDAPGVSAVRDRLIKVHGFPEGISLSVADSFAARLFLRKQELLKGMEKNEST